MKNVLLAGMAFVMMAVTSCSKDRLSGSGEITTDTRQVSNFTGIRSNGSSDVTITKGAFFEVKVQGYQNLLPYFETKLDNGILVVGYKDVYNVRNSNIRVSITMPTLTSVYVNGSADITTIGNFNNNNNFESTVNGSGSINLQQGEAKNFKSYISGSGDIHAFGFIADKANVEISGSGTTHLSASAQLDVKISGSGNVYYKGSPVLTSHISGSGRVAKQ